LRAGSVGCMVRLKPQLGQATSWCFIVPQRGQGMYAMLPSCRSFKSIDATPQPRGGFLLCLYSRQGNCARCQAGCTLGEHPILSRQGPGLRSLPLSERQAWIFFRQSRYN
jgi:hypothetical protein